MTMARFRDAMRRDYMGRTPPVTSATLTNLDAVVGRMVKIGFRTTDDLDDDGAARFLAEGLADAPPGTRAHLDAFFRAICRRAFKMGIVAGVPNFPPAATFVAGDGRVPCPSLPEVQKLLDHVRARAAAWKDHRLFTVISVAAWTGLGRKEVCGLRAGDIDLAGGTIGARGRREKTVRIPSELGQVLARWLPRAGSEWAFPGDQRIGPWNEVRAADALRDAARGAGVAAASSFEALRLFFERHAVPTIPGLDPGIPPRPRGDATATETTKVRTGPPWVPTPEEATRLMAAMREGSATWKGHRLYAVAGLAFFTGLRVGTSMRLRLEDLHLDRTPAMLCIPGEEPVTLADEAAAILRRWLGRRDRGGTAWVFPDDSLIGPWPMGYGRGSGDPMLQQAGRDAGIRERVNIDALAKLHRRCAGRVERGDAWRSIADPEPILDGPGGRGPGGRTRAGMGELQGEIAAGRPDLARWDPPIPSIVIGGPDDPVIVLDKDKGRLRGKGQHKVIKAIFDSSSGGLTLRRIVEETGVKSARQLIDRLRASDPDWELAIETPDDRGGLYRIRPRGALSI